MGNIENQLEKRLKGTFKKYITHGIDHALSEAPTENDVLQVIVNMQASLELLSKLFVLQHEGWKGILKNEYHNKSESEIISAIENGTVKTKPYWKNKNFVSQEIYLNEDDKALLSSFQEHRNQVMHLGTINPSKEILYESIWLIVRIINQLNWQDTLPLKDQYLANSLESMLGEKLYERLLSNSCYVGEAIDRAYELAPRDVKYCLQCSEEAWVLNNDDYRVCLVCGFRGDENIFGFADCPLCNSEGTVVFDPLNIDINEQINGKCCSCRKLVPVSNQIL